MDDVKAFVDSIVTQINTYSVISAAGKIGKETIDTQALSLALDKALSKTNIPAIGDTVYHKLYEDLKTEYEILLGRYEMVRMQYVRIRTQKMAMVTNSPAFVAGRPHPEIENTRVIKNLYGLKRTKDAIKRAKTGPIDSGDEEILLSDDNLLASPPDAARKDALKRHAKKHNRM